MPSIEELKIHFVFSFCFNVHTFHQTNLAAPAPETDAGMQRDNRKEPFYFLFD